TVRSLDKLGRLDRPGEMDQVACETGQTSRRESTTAPTTISSTPIDTKIAGRLIASSRSVRVAKRTPPPVHRPKPRKPPSDLARTGGRVPSRKASAQRPTPEM